MTAASLKWTGQKLITSFQVQKPKTYKQKNKMRKALFGNRIKFLQKVQYLHHELIKILTENHTIDVVKPELKFFFLISKEA